MKNQKINKSKDRTFSLVLVIIGLTLISGFGFFKFYQVNQELRAAMPYLMPGQAIEYFDILGQDAQSRNVSILEGDKPALLFVFSRPCSPCNNNIIYWKKIAALLKNKVKVYGIVLGKIDETFELTEKAKPGFDVYVPEDLETFIKSMKLQLNFPQTIIYRNNRVVYQKMGDLTGPDAASIIKKAKSLI